MSRRQREIKDPVCNMMVAYDHYAIDYLGMHFAFCSQQCKTRFLANPHLYIGQAGHKSPKQEGQVILKRRKFRLSEPLPEALAANIAGQIQAMMGIKGIVVEGDTIEITYDLLEATAEQIEARLETAGASLGRDWGQHLRRAFVHYAEETEVDTLETPPAHHQHHH